MLCPGILGMPGSMVIRYDHAQTEYTPPPPPPPAPGCSPCRCHIGCYCPPLAIASLGVTVMSWVSLSCHRCRFYGMADVFMSWASLLRPTYRHGIVGVSIAYVMGIACVCRGPGDSTPIGRGGCGDARVRRGGYRGGCGNQQVTA